MSHKPDRPDPAPIASDDEGNKLAKKDFEEKQAAEAEVQNLPEGGVPEQRPQAFLQPADQQQSAVFTKLQEAGDDRAGNSGLAGVGAVHDKSNFDAAASQKNANAAAKESRFPARLYPGARGWIDNPGEPDNGRAIAINGVAEWASVEDERIAAAGSPESRFAVVKSYEAVTRDGRSELMIVSAEHVRPDTTGGNEWGKTPLMNAL